MTLPQGSELLGNSVKLYECTSSIDDQDSQRHDAVNYAKKSNRVTSKRERMMKRQTLQQVITARQEKIYAQQCEIDELRRRVQAISTDNKFLRDQNYWQAKALERLDGKHAELPQIINSHLEEIRVFREQIKRMKQVLKLEKQRRQEAEASNEKTLVELRHLRRLAEEQNLLEREELMHTIEKLQSETQERGKLLTNLEKYAENLEKNQRFESIRHARTRKELKDTCQNLLDRIQVLEQTVQEKQKIIELQNIYSNRMWKSQTIGKKPDPSCLVTNPLESETLGSSERNRPSRRDLSDKVAKIDKKRRNCPSPVEHDSAHGYRPGAKFERRKSFSSGDQANMDLYRNACHSTQHDASTRSARDAIVLPKLPQRQDLACEDTREAESESKLSHDNKQVRFSASAHATAARKEELAFQQLRTKELEARMAAEKHLEQEEEVQVSLMHQNMNMIVCSGGDGRLADCNRPSDMDKHICGKDVKISPGTEFVGKNIKPLDESVDINQEKDTHIILDGNANSSMAVPSNSPIPSRTASELSTCDSSTLIPIQETIDQHVCRPCGDQDIDEFFIADSSGDSSCESMNDDYMLWREETSANNTRSSGESSSQTAVQLDYTTIEPVSNPCPAAEISQSCNEKIAESSATENVKKSVLVNKDLPLRSCAVRTTTLYTTNKNNTEEVDDSS